MLIELEVSGLPLIQDKLEVSLQKTISLLFKVADEYKLLLVPTGMLFRYH
jgi:hypothetical protein